MEDNKKRRDIGSPSAQTEPSNGCEGQDSASATPTPGAKRGKTDLSLQDLQESILSKINESTDLLLSKIHRNGQSLRDIALKTASVFTEVKEVRNSVETLRQTTAAQENRIKDLEQKLNALEAHHRRCNVCVHGLPQKGENLKKMKDTYLASEVNDGKKRKIMGASPSSSSSIKNDFTASMDSPMHAVPLEILEEVFHNLPCEEVVRHCRLVCKPWKEVADSESLWRERCRREGYLPRNASVVPRDWREFYFLCKKRRNLLKNTKAAENFMHWQIESNGGDGWTIVNSEQPHGTPNKAFVTSFATCLKSQLINLKSEGYSPAFMDQYQPPIKISDWYGALHDCPCEYTIKVDLLNQKKKCIQTFERARIHVEQLNVQHWHQVTHVFKNYGPGVRYIKFVHGGKDRLFWKGWYGVRVTDSSVEVCPEQCWE